MSRSHACGFRVAALLASSWIACACGGGGSSGGEDTGTDVQQDDAVEQDTATDTAGDSWIDVVEETGDAPVDPALDETGDDTGGDPAEDDAIEDDAADTAGDETAEPGWCGDGSVDAGLGEQCDDANETPGDGCENDCTWTCATDAQCLDADACNGEETCEPSSHTCTPGLAPADGAECEADTVVTTRDICLATVCVQSACGDSFADPGNGEACDDGNGTPDDGCENNCTVTGTVPTAYRFITMAIVDPHLYSSVVIWCQDITGTANNEFQNSIDDLSINMVDVFRPLDTSLAMTPNEFYSDAACTAGTPDDCTFDPADTPVRSMANNVLDTATPCLLPDAAVLNPAYADPNTPMGECFVTDEEVLGIDMGGVPIVFQDARIAAEYSAGSPPGTLVSGVLVGFMSTADAMIATLPADLPLIGGDTLYEHLADGKAPGSACTGISSFSTDDSDLDSGGADGFWFHINFTAELVNWTDA